MTDSITIRQLMDEAWTTSEEKGFHTLLKTFGDDIALMHSELSEALEEFRHGHDFSEIYYSDGGKVEGIAAEIADVLIRIGDVCENWGIPIEEALRLKLEYNKTRSFLHGGKKL